MRFKCAIPLIKKSRWAYVNVKLHFFNLHSLQFVDDPLTKSECCLNYKKHRVKILLMHLYIKIIPEFYPEYIIS